jgi:hypothetical protein
MYNDLKEWCEDGTLYIRCLDDIYDGETKVCEKDKQYIVWDVIQTVYGEVLLTIDTGYDGITWCVSMDDEDFEIVCTENDTNV